jgi:hypothetical protein
MIKTSVSVKVFGFLFFLGVFSAYAASSANEVVWNGDSIGTQAMGWAAPSNMSSVKSETGSGVDSSVGLKWRAEGKDWMGFGWNWYRWWPADAGTDTTVFSYLVFKIKITASPSGKLPIAETLTVSLSSSGNPGKMSDSVNIAKYAADITDGKWHQVSIPLKDFMVTDKGKMYNPRSVWEFDFGSWSEDKRSFTVYFDDIGFETVKTGEGK